MIFVTVGTVGFDPLIAEVDRLAGAGVFEDEVFAQIGLCRDEPQHIRFERYLRDLPSYMASASLIIAHAGTGSICECIASGKPFVAVVDAAKAGNHQYEFAAGMAERFDYCWIDHPEKLRAALPQARPARRLADETTAGLAADIRRVLLRQ
jgi:UDP-N-acetylglucosamine transferase subunit ALG13